MATVMVSVTDLGSDCAEDGGGSISVVVVTENGFGEELVE